MPQDERFDNHFCNELNSFLDEYEASLASKGLTKNTIHKHGHLISSFLWFLDGYTTVQGFEDLTKAMLNSKLREYLRNNYPGEFTDSFVAFALKGFFSFIHEAHGISTALIKKEFGF